MAGTKSDYLENKVLDHVLGKTTFTAASTLYIALFTVAPSDAGGGTEVSADGYARIDVTNNTTNFPNASGGQKSNGTDITFVTATTSWGTIVAFGAFDSSTAGNLYYWGTVSTDRDIEDGDTVIFRATNLIIQED